MIRVVNHYLIQTPTQEAVVQIPDNITGEELRERLEEIGLGDLDPADWDALIGKINAAKLGIASMPDWATATPAQAAKWIDNNVTNLATAKAALKKLALMVFYMRDALLSDL